MKQLMDLSKQVSTVAGNEIRGDNIGNASVNPAPNGRPRDLQIGEEVPMWE